MNKETRKALNKVLAAAEERLELIKTVVAELAEVIAQRMAQTYLCPTCEQRFSEQEAGTAKGQCPAGCDEWLVRVEAPARPTGPRVVDDPEGAADRYARFLAATKGKDEDGDDDPEVDEDKMSPEEGRRRRVALPGAHSGPRIVDDEDDEAETPKKPARKPAHDPYANDVQMGVRKSQRRQARRRQAGPTTARHEQKRRPSVPTRTTWRVPLDLIPWSRVTAAAVAGAETRSTIATPAGRHPSSIPT